MGYTNEMQANVRGKLFNMLGDRGEVAAAAAAAPSSSSSRSVNRKMNAADADPGFSAVTGKADREIEADEDDYNSNELDGVQIDMINAGDYGEFGEDFEWVCNTCTLINEPSSLSCLTCDAIRIQ